MASSLRRPAPVVYAAAMVAAALLAGCSASAPNRAASSHRLGAVWSFDGGQTQLRPPPKSLQPHLKPGSAMAHFRASDAYSAYIARRHRASVRFAVLGGRGAVTGVGSAGTPVWVITYRGVGFAPGGGVTEHHAASHEVMVTDAVVIESDATGQVLVELLDKPVVSRSR